MADSGDHEWYAYVDLFGLRQESQLGEAGRIQLRPQPHARSRSSPNSPSTRSQQTFESMANFNSFNEAPNPGNPNARGTQPPSNTAAQLNGIGGARHWPDLGVQMDMNVLWEYVNNLSQIHEGIRAQTQNVLHGVQQIQARDAREVRGERGEGGPVGGRLEAVNGALNGKPAKYSK